MTARSCVFTLPRNWYWCQKWLPLELRNRWGRHSRLPEVIGQRGRQECLPHLFPATSPAGRRARRERSSSCLEVHDALGTDAAGRFFFVDVAPLGVAHPGGGPLSPADAGDCRGGRRGLGVVDHDATRLPHQPGGIAQPHERLQPPLARIHQRVRRQGGRGRRRGRGEPPARSPPR